MNICECFDICKIIVSVLDPLTVQLHWNLLLQIKSIVTGKFFILILLTNSIKGIPRYLHI